MLRADVFFFFCGKGTKKKKTKLCAIFSPFMLFLPLGTAEVHEHIVVHVTSNAQVQCRIRNR